MKPYLVVIASAFAVAPAFADHTSFTGPTRTITAPATAESLRIDGQRAPKLPVVSSDRGPVHFARPKPLSAARSNSSPAHESSFRPYLRGQHRG